MKLDRFAIAAVAGLAALLLLFSRGSGGGGYRPRGPCNIEPPVTPVPKSYSTAPRGET